MKDLVQIKSINKAKTENDLEEVKNEEIQENEDKDKDKNKLNLANNFFSVVGEKTQDKNLNKIFSKDVFQKSSNRQIKFDSNDNEFNPIVSIKGESKVNNIDKYINDQKCLSENFNEIRDSWKFSILSPFRSFPEEKVRNYFGEKVCLYYHYFLLYTRFLSIISFVGFIVYILQITDTYESRNIEIFYDKGIQKSRYVIIINCFYSFFVITWSTIFIEIWKRQEAKHASLWGQGELESREAILPTFRGKIRRSPFNDEMNEPYSSRFKFIVRQILAYLISLAIVVILITFVVLLLIYKNNISRNNLGGEYNNLYVQFPSKKKINKYLINYFINFQLF